MSDTDNFPFYIALEPPGTPFDSSTMARADFQIFAFKIEHNEADSPTLTIDIKNPRQGLLNLVGSNTWAWFSWNDGGTIEPLMFGRLVAIPTDMLGEVVTLNFSAQPSDFLAQKQAIAEGLQVRPYWDAVFIEASRRLDPDAMLEGYSASWHVDRISNAVTISDVLVGEEGTFEYTEDMSFYDSVKMSVDKPPLKSVFVNAKITWKQQDTGVIDMGNKVITSYSDSIQQNWPKPRTSLGGGWVVDFSTAVDSSRSRHATTHTVSSSFRNSERTHNFGDTMSVDWTATTPFFFAPSESSLTATITSWNTIAIIDEDPDGFNQPTATAGYTTMTVVGWVASLGLFVRYEAARDRTENVRFTLGADVQSVFSDPGGTQANFAQDAELIDVQGSVGLEGPYGTYRGDWQAGEEYFLYDYFTTIIGGVVHAFSATRDHISLSSFDPQATATVWQAGARLGAGENVYFGGVYYSVNISHIANSGTGFFYGPPPTGQSNDGEFLFSLIVDPHAGPRLYQEVPGFKGPWAAGSTYVPNDIFIAPDDGTYYSVAIGHVSANPFNKFATDVTGKLLLTQLLNPAPIGDVSRRSYLPTDRGAWSLEHLIMRARAALCWRSRAVKISFECRFQDAVFLTCRKNAILHDSRIPGGQAIGKVVSYELSMTEGQAPIGKVTIACAVGNGNTITPSDGTPSYVDPGYVDVGYQYYDGRIIATGTGDVGYTPALDAPIDDGLIFPLDKSQAVVGETVKTTSIADQIVLQAAQTATNQLFQPPLTFGSQTQDPQATQAQRFLTAIASTTTWYKATFKPVVNGPFDNRYDISVTEQMIPKQIDLSAASFP